MTMTKGGNSRYNSRDNDRDSGVVVKSELLHVGQERGKTEEKQDKTRQDSHCGLRDSLAVR